jgi:hypothetical protein
LSTCTIRQSLSIYQIPKIVVVRPSRQSVVGSPIDPDDLVFMHQLPNDDPPTVGARVASSNPPDHLEQLGVAVPSE